MCTVCGCGTAVFTETPDVDGARQSHAHAASGHHHDHAASHHHHDHATGLIDFGNSSAGLSVPGLAPERLISIERDILAKNQLFASANRNLFRKMGVLTINLLSSPGSGKTSLLVRTIGDLKDRWVIAVIEGDQQTTNDAVRIRQTGAKAIQINTGKGCHLDAHMIDHAIEHLALEPETLLFIENVGNLVCPAAFDLGEAAKVVVLSVTEGEDKPLKYPDMFAAADLMLLNKTDLLPHLDFDLDACKAAALRVNPRLEILTVSARTGDGLSAFYTWIEAHAATARAQDVGLACCR